jgi:hypothetical protein
MKIILEIDIPSIDDEADEALQIVQSEVKSFERQLRELIPGATIVIDDAYTADTSAQRRSLP